MFGKPGLVFSGANRQVLAQVKKATVLPIGRSDRDHSRVAPHDVIVNLSKLAKLQTLSPPTQIGMTFANRDPRWSRAATKSDFKIKIAHDTFDFGYGGGDYSTSWNGGNNKDGDSGKAVRTSNVLVLDVKTHRDHNTTSHLSDVSETIGKAKVTIYHDGRKLAGSWQRDSLAGPMRFVDGLGQDIPLKPGKSWILLHG